MAHSRIAIQRTFCPLNRKCDSMRARRHAIHRPMMPALPFRLCSFAEKVNAALSRDLERAVLRRQREIIVGCQHRQTSGMTQDETTTANLSYIHGSRALCTRNATSTTSTSAKIQNPFFLSHLMASLRIGSSRILSTACFIPDSYNKSTKSRRDDLYIHRTPHPQLPSYSRPQKPVTKKESGL